MPVLFFFPVLGFELRVFTLSYTTIPLFFFVMGIFKIGPHDLVAWAGFEL
jgi:hypothetical protein